MTVAREKEILGNLDVTGMSTETRESTIRAVVEKLNIDFGRTVHCRGEHPNREWTNDPADFEPTPEEKAAAVEAEKQRKLAEMTENDVLRKKLEAAEAQLALMSGGKPPKLSLPPQPTK